MAPRQPVTQEDANVALTVTIMYAAGSMQGADGDAVRAMAASLWPKSIKREALEYGAGAVEVVARAFGIDAEQLAKVAQHMFAAE